MKICPKCNIEYSDDKSNCYNCDTLLNTIEVNPESQENEKKYFINKNEKIENDESIDDLEINNVPDYFFLSLLAAFIFTLGGIGCIIYSAITRAKKREGKLNEALKYSKITRYWIIATVIIGLIINYIFLASGLYKNFM